MLIRKKYELIGHSSGIYCLGGGTKSGKLFSGSADTFLAEWDIHEEEASKFSVKLGAPVYSFTHLTENKIAIGLSNGHFHIIDLHTKTEIKHIIRHTLGVYSIQQKADGTVFTAGGDGVLNHWSSNFNLLQSLRLAAKKIRCIRVWQETLLVCSGDGVLLAINLNDIHVSQTMPHEKGSVNCVLALSESTIISAGWDGHLYQWQQGQIVKRIPAHNYAVYGIELIGNGSYFATASRDKTIKIWNSATLEFCARIDFKSHQSHRYSVNCLYFDSESKLLFSGSDDRKIMAWEVDVNTSI